MTSPKIKICGIQNLDDALFCESLQIDAIGLVFYQPSPRVINISTAREIIANLPPFITVVGVFANADTGYVNDVLSQINIDSLQFHGEENNRFCNQFNKKWIKAVRVQDGLNLNQEISKFPNASAILLDSFDKKIIGGTGKTFNWSYTPNNINQPLILAGGLNSQNVQNAISQINPWAVDVSGGVEIKKGIKSKVLIKDFVSKVRS